MIPICMACVKDINYSRFNLKNPSLQGVNVKKDIKYSRSNLNNFSLEGEI